MKYCQSSGAAAASHATRELAVITGNNLTGCGKINKSFPEKEKGRGHCREKTEVSVVCHSLCYKTPRHPSLWPSIFLCSSRKGLVSAKRPWEDIHMLWLLKLKREVCKFQTLRTAWYLPCIVDERLQQGQDAPGWALQTFDCKLKTRSSCPTRTMTFGRLQPLRDSDIQRQTGRQVAEGNYMQTRELGFWNSDRWGPELFVTQRLNPFS